MYFDQVAVGAKDPDGEPVASAAQDGSTLSLADFVFCDYFLLLARQMVQALADGLQAYTYLIQEAKSSDQVVDWVNSTGRLAGPVAYSLGRLFDDNQEHPLTVGSSLLICGARYAVQDSDSFDSIAAHSIYAAGFSGSDLASQGDKAADTVRLLPGAMKNLGHPDNGTRPGFARQHCRSPRHQLGPTVGKQ